MGMKVKTLYFWFLMTFVGNFCRQSRPSHTVLEAGSLWRQQRDHAILQQLSSKSKSIRS